MILHNFVFVFEGVCSWLCFLVFCVLFYKKGAIEKKEGKEGG